MDLLYINYVLITNLMH